ncbi:hypothetical protein Tco_1498755 [Tanacetum coccineum]
MVACLERIDRKADFHEIVDFLTGSPIHYALTISPTIYVSYIEQFWNTVHSQPISDVKQIHAIIDGKTILISELLVRSDLHFNDEDGITCLTNDAIFDNLALMGKALQEDTRFPQTSVPIPNVADEVVFKEWDDRVVRATTTAASLGDRPRCQEAMGGVIAQTRSDRSSKHSYDLPLLGGNTPRSDEERIEQDDLMDFVPPTPYDSPLSGGHTPGSDEGKPNINELMAICTNLLNRVLALEQSKTAQDLVIKKLKNRSEN